MLRRSVTACYSQLLQGSLGRCLSTEVSKSIVLKEYGLAEDVLSMVEHKKPAVSELGEHDVLMRMLAVRVGPGCVERVMPTAIPWVLCSCGACGFRRVWYSFRIQYIGVRVSRFLSGFVFASAGAN